MARPKKIIEETNECNICKKPLLRGEDTMMEIGVPAHTECFIRGDKK